MDDLDLNLKVRQTTKLVGSMWQVIAFFLIVPGSAIEQIVWLGTSQGQTVMGRSNGRMPFADSLSRTFDFRPAASDGRASDLNMFRSMSILSN